VPASGAGLAAGASLQPDRIWTRERGIQVAGLVFISALAWAWILYLSSAMDTPAAAAGSMPGMDMTVARPWQGADIIFTFLMWAVMMVAMMTPVAAPMVLTFGGLQKGRVAVARTATFVSGYFIMWTSFAVVATLLQWAFHSAGMLSPHAMAVAPAVGGTLLILAGLYQFTPQKHACLSRCSSPLAFLMTEWREGAHGALVMGLRHGAFCVGCCWAVMLLLFVVGVMNLLWVAIIAAFVLLERLVSAGRWVACAGGLLGIACGIWLLVS
jgi:predicted metal-binding membrane protein